MHVILQEHISIHNHHHFLNPHINTMLTHINTVHLNHTVGQDLMILSQKNSILHIILIKILLKNSCKIDTTYLITSNLIYPMISYQRKPSTILTFRLIMLNHHINSHKTIQLLFSCHNQLLFHLNHKNQNLSNKILLQLPSKTLMT